MAKTKVVKSLKIIKNGSNPDVDSDFHTLNREKVLDYVTNLYGKDNVSNIVTFGTLAAKGAVKAMCTIYNIPFAQAGKLAALVPGPVEGKDCTLNDIYDPTSDRYDEAAEFRSFASGSEWEKIITGARKIEGKNKSTGVHACFTSDTLIKTSEGYKNIDEIKVGDFVLTHTNSYKEVVNTMINKSDEIFNLSAANSLPSDVTGNHPLYVRTIERSKDRTRSLSAPVWKDVSELVVGDDLIGVPVNNDKKMPENELDLPFDNLDFWWIAGRFIGDGWCEDFTSTRNRTKKDGTPYKYKRQEKRTVISVGYNDPTRDLLIDKIGQLFSYRISHTKTTDKIYINNNDLFEYFKTFGKYAQNKFVPDEVVSLPINLLEEVIKGYLSADGWFNKKNESYTFSTVSKKLALSMISAINKVYKVHCSVIVEKRDKMTIEGREVKCHDRYNLKFKKNVTKKQQSFYKDGYIWAGLTRVEKLDKNIDTYNFSVLDDNSYVANGLIAHNCGILISAKPLHDVIPLQVRQTDHRVITQWTYQECESLGLIKMDFLGLDTVDLIQNAVGYIIKSGKNVPNMVDLVHGDMDDPKVYKLFQDAHTTGIFQFGSEMVQDLLKLVKPTEFDDLAATTAVARPGPMGMLSHIKYADRKNNREEIDFVHSEFIGSPIEEILGKTYGLIVYQEQIIKIASEIAGMTLQEGDDLRSAMGKKKMAVMKSMKPKFFEGCYKNGYSEEATTILWETIEEFAKYGFNKSHSVAYAMNSYQSAYLKAHYPIEFMAALISQNVDDKKKTLSYLREAKRMKIDVGTVDINLSDIKVAPDFNNGSRHDILFGISGVKSVSEDIAKIIVEERIENGLYESVQDLINRCIPLGVSNRAIYENLAKSGAFDAMDVSRKSVVEAIPDLMGDAKNKKSKGESLFDMFSLDDDPSEVDLNGEEYNFVKKLQEEANMVGLYLTANPLDNLGPGSSKLRTNNISKILKSSRSVATTILGSVIEVTKKQRRQGKSIIVDIDDGSDYMTALLAKDIVKNIDKFNAQENVKKLYQNGDNSVSDDNRDLSVDPAYKAMEDLEVNNVYMMNITFRPGRGDNPYNAKINWIKPLNLSHNGSLPVRIRFKANKENLDRMKKLYRALPANLSKKIPGDYPIHVSLHSKLTKDSHNSDNMYIKAIEEMDKDKANGVDLKSIDEQNKTNSNSSSTLMGNINQASGKNKKKSKSKQNGSLRNWPPASFEKSNKNSIEALTVEDITDAIESLNYIDTGLTCDKNQKVELAIEKFLGIESYDFGIFDSSILLDD